MATYEQHLQNLRAQTRVSAREAVDFLDNNQRTHMETLLDTEGVGIRDWRKRGVMVLWENLVGHVVDRSAQTYQDQPAREIVIGKRIDRGLTERYGELLDESNAFEVLEDADLLARLLKTAIVLVQYEKETGQLYFSVLSQHNADVQYNRVTRRFDSLLYTGGGIGPGGGQLYHYWTPEKVVDLEVSANSSHYSAKVVHSENHDYGIVPAAALHDIRPPRYGFWSKPVWEQLVYFNKAVNMFAIESKFNQRFGSLGSLFTNMKIKEGQVVGPDCAVEMDATPGVDNFLDYRAPQVQLEHFSQVFDGLRENLGLQWGVNIRMAGRGSADSGFKLIVEELPGLQLRKKRQKPAVTFEQDLYKVVGRVSEAVGLGLRPEGRAKISFAEPDLPVNEKEEWDIAQGQMASGVLSRKDYLKGRYPNLSDQEIDRKITEIDAESNLGRLPDFDGATNA